MSTKIQVGNISPNLTVDQEQITVNVAQMGVDQDILNMSTKEYVDQERVI